jgi:hypothetical protein
MFDVILGIMCAIVIIAFIISLPAFKDIAWHNKVDGTFGRQVMSKSEIEFMRIEAIVGIYLLKKGRER